MKLIIWSLLVILNGAMCSGSGDSEHVHFKIHVPDIVKHLFHTKTVFVHVHEPKKKVPKKKRPNHRKEEHHEEWSSWSSHGHHEHKHSHEKNQSDRHSNEKVQQHNEQGHHQNSRTNTRNEDFHKEFHKDFPSHNEQPKKTAVFNYNSEYHLPQWNSYNREQYRNPANDEWVPGKIPEYSPQYAVHENVKDTRSNEVDPYNYQYAKGYRKGRISETKHLYEDHSNKFEDSNHEEEDESKASYEDESKELTHAGRYFIDDTEYENYRQRDSSSRKNHKE